MRPNRVPPSLFLVLAACLIMGAGRSAAQPNPSSDLLLPYFDVGALCEDVTTLFAVGNAAGRPVPVRGSRRRQQPGLPSQLAP